MLRRSISFVALLFAIVSTVGSEVFAQPASNNPGVILEGTAGRMAYKDDSGGVDRREFTVRAGYRMCPYCSGFGQRIRLMPYLSLGISDLAGLSHRSTNSAAISALDFGLAGVINAGNVVRLELAAATGFKRTAERFTTVGTGREFINLSGAGGRRVAFQIHRVCLPLPLIGRRTLVAGVSSTKGRYDTVELAGDTRSLPQPTNYKSTAFSIGIQSRTLLSDCAGL